MVKKFSRGTLTFFGGGSSRSGSVVWLQGSCIALQPLPESSSNSLPFHPIPIPFNVRANQTILPICYYIRESVTDIRIGAKVAGIPGFDKWYLLHSKLCLDCWRTKLLQPFVSRQHQGEHLTNSCSWKSPKLFQNFISCQSLVFHQTERERERVYMEGWDCDSFLGQLQFVSAASSPPPIPQIAHICQPKILLPANWPNQQYFCPSLKDRRYAN